MYNTPSKWKWGSIFMVEQSYSTSIQDWKFDFKFQSSFSTEDKINRQLLKISPVYWSQRHIRHEWLGTCELVFTLLKLWKVLLLVILRFSEYTKNLHYFRTKTKTKSSTNNLLMKAWHSVYNTFILIINWCMLSSI